MNAVACTTFLEKFKAVREQTLEFCTYILVGSLLLRNPKTTQT